METQTDKEKGRELLAKVKEKSEDDYEKNITYISAGTLVLSLTFIEKVTNLSLAVAVWTLIMSWILLALTLLANLVSHQLSCLYHERTICDFDNDDPKLDIKINKRNSVIRGINWGTTFSLFTGILFLILFCSINASKMANEKKDLHKVNDPNYLEKGRTIISPVKPNTSSSSGTNSPTPNPQTNPTPSTGGNTKTPKQ